MYYLLVDNKDIPFDGVVQSNKTAEEVQKIVDSLQSQGIAGSELIDALEEYGIKYVHLEDDHIIVE